ncbi:hypothetical protein QQ020_00370 [Fulvivirgaceae bacterium BMA12]|uniref:Uncharacterized protein n=1 Tax=Agaribacillus aureus TaxID=3051825 RepID=A0ABT8KY92_9BACT|nr:hypothetical protein [Fulvivirgaceae bacterium BMA12]
MNDKTVNQIWSFLMLIGLFTALNSSLRSQGSELYFNLVDVKNADESAITVYGILISVPLLLLATKLASIHGLNKNQKKWYVKYPVAFNVEIEPHSLLGKRYQQFSLVIFHVLPLVLIGHLLNQFFGGCVFVGCADCKGLPSEVAISNKCLANDIWGHLSLFFNARVTFANYFGYAESTTSNGKITFFPGYQSWLMLVMAVGYVVYSMKYLYELTTRRS